MTGPSVIREGQADRAFCERASLATSPVPQGLMSMTGRRPTRYGLIRSLERSTVAFGVA
jgi:hypothetical protein